MKTWDGFLAGVKKLKAAGITPIALGAKDKWPAHFWWSKLVVRLAGKDEFNAAAAGKGDGFAGPDFVEGRPEVPDSSPHCIRSRKASRPRPMAMPRAISATARPRCT